jgi:hypothetical protein
VLHLLLSYPHGSPAACMLFVGGQALTPVCVCAGVSSVFETTHGWAAPLRGVCNAWWHAQRWLQAYKHGPMGLASSPLSRPRPTGASCWWSVLSHSDVRICSTWTRGVQVGRLPVASPAAAMFIFKALTCLNGYGTCVCQRMII